MGPSRLHWDDVRLLLALARSRSLGEAARRLRVDTSTASRRLRGLEEALDTTLFDRGRSGISATEAAERLLPVAEEIEHAMARFTGTAETFDREIAGLVRIACPPDAAEVRLAPLLPELRARHPGLRFHVEASEGLVDVARRRTDLALRIVRPVHGELVVTRLETIETRLAVAPSLAAALGPVRDLRDVPLVSWGEAYAHVSFARWLVAAASGVEPVFRSDSLRTQIAAVRSGVGAGLVPGPSIPFYGLVPLPLSTALRRALPPFPRDELYLVTHRALRNVPRVRAVWDHLVERIAKRPPRPRRSSSAT